MFRQQTFEELLQFYYAQLLNGCNAVKCNNIYCRSSGDQFEYKDMTREDLDLVVVDFASENETQPRLCPTLSPLLLKPSLYMKLFTFHEFYNAFIHDQQIKKTQMQTLRNVLSDYDAFSHLFLKTDTILSGNDLSFDSNMAEEFYETINRRTGIISRLLNDYTHTIKQIFSISKEETLHWIRSIFVSFLFPCYLPRIASDKFLIPLMKTVIRMSPRAISIFCNTLANYPIFFHYILDPVQNTITEYLNTKPDTHPHCQEMHAFASFIEIMAAANNQLPNPLPAKIFVNDKFNSFLLAKYEYKLFRKKIFSYLKTTSILNLPFKCQVLKEDTGFWRRNAGRSRTVTIRREYIFDDALEKVLSKNPDIQKGMTISFEGEHAQDAGGVSREFFYLLANQVFSEGNDMFKKINDQKFYWFNQFSDVPLDYFKAIGTLIGLAVFNSIILPVRFPLFFYKKLFGVPLEFCDLEEYDPTIAKNLQQLKNSAASGEDISSSDMVFVASLEKSPGKGIDIPLIEGGEEKPVTNENVEEFINLYMEYLLNESIAGQFDQFKQGFQSICQNKIMRKFHYYDFDLLVSGEEIFDWDALKNNTIYDNGYTDKSDSIVIFWEIFESMNPQEKGKLLQFITGSDRAPIGGLATITMTIQRSGDMSKLPTSHTCFNLLVLPDYKDEIKMSEVLRVCSENAEGFGII